MMSDMNDDLSLNSSTVATTLSRPAPPSLRYSEQHLQPMINIVTKRLSTPDVLPLSQFIHGIPHDNSLSPSPLNTTTPAPLSPILSKPIAVALIPKRKLKGLKAAPEPKLWATDERNDISLLDETYQHALTKMRQLDTYPHHDEENEQGSSSRGHRLQQSAPSSSRRMLTDRSSNSNSFPAINQTSSDLTNPKEEGEGETQPQLSKSPQTIDPSSPTPPPPSSSPPPPLIDDEPKLKVVESKAKNKLQNLNKFVLGHTSRKITSNWDLVENKFQSSPTHEIVIIKGENGIGNPVKYKTLTLSSLTLLLCSQQIQIKFKELLVLYEMLKYSKEQIILSCKLAARKLVMNSSTKVEVQQQCQQEMNDLLAATVEPKVRIDLLKEVVFSSDPEERKKEFEQLEKFRSERVAILIEEKKRKKENLEKAETRKRKAMHDFENCLQSVQYPRGPLNAKRFRHLKQIIEYCYNSLLEEYYEKTVAVDPLVIELIGPDMFPQTTTEVPNTARGIRSTATFNENDDETLQSPNEAKLLALRKAGFIRRDFIPETWKIDLIGPPSLVDIFRQTLKTGKGLYGTSNTDVVELLQTYCATRISAYYRGFTRRWRYQVARRAWKHLYHFMKSKVFVAWASETKQIRTLRHYCHRKIKAWSFFTRRAVRRRHYFRVCYWPLFVWR